MSADKNIAKIEKYTKKRKPEKIIGFLKNKDKTTRLAAIRALRNFEDNDDAYNNLITILDNPDIDERIAAAESLSSSKRDSACTYLNHLIGKETNKHALDVMKDAVSSIHKNIAALHTENI